MSHDLNDLIIDLYDEHIRTIGGEVKSADAMAAIRPQVVSILAKRKRDVDSEAAAVIRVAVSSKRDARRTTLKRDLEWLLDGAFDEDGAYVDPIMDRAYGLGRADGADKTLRTWTMDDFDFLVKTHYRVAAESTAAAAELDRIAEQIKDRMRAAGATILGDVQWDV